MSEQIITEAIVIEHQVVSEITKRKVGRPKGSIIPTAICRNPELKKEQKIRLDASYKQTKSYILSKIKTLSTKYDLLIDSTDTMTEDELKILLIDIKVNNLIERATRLKKGIISI